MFPRSSFQTAGANPGSRFVSLDLPGLFKHPLSKIQFKGRPLRDLLIQAIRYGERPEIRAKLTQAIANAVDCSHLQDLLEERALAHDVMDASRVARVREDMERAEARPVRSRTRSIFYFASGTTRPRASSAMAAPVEHARLNSYAL